MSRMDGNRYERGPSPRVDDHLVEPEVTRDEIIGGRRVLALPSEPPRATQRTRLEGNKRVCEWSAEIEGWSPLGADTKIEDSCFVTPFPVTALFDRAVADKAVLAALTAKRNPAALGWDAAARPTVELDAKP